MLDNKHQYEVDGNSVEYKPKNSMSPKYTRNNKKPYQKSQDTANQTRNPPHRLANAQEREYHLAQIEANNVLKQMDIAIQNLATHVTPAPELPPVAKLTEQSSKQFVINGDLSSMNPIKQIIYSKLMAR
ncbi:hypothetical protein HLH17_16340 [Acinetobacter sp. ANC 5380]|uniref:Uncharacterized protein n=1 Tax=Acinetobacter terrae TaxID=2731247 RepID=A0A7Y2RI16_9GAMM|nr:hypothetical protein [Acinetobacter terrae]NNH79187.1 hypothetical protein [Acinetobacter terrae]